MGFSILRRRAVASVVNLSGLREGARVSRGHATFAQDLVDISNAGNLVEAGQSQDQVVIRDVISADEHDALVAEILHTPSDTRLERFRRKKYEQDHWDSVIVGYKELERPLFQWSDGNRIVIERLRNVVAEHLHKYVAGVPEEITWLPPHVIDLAADGIIKPHVDSVKFSGFVVAGLSLLSERTMRLAPDQGDQEGDANPSIPHIDLTLPPRSLYILCNAARYNLAHSIEPSKGAERRLSLILRDDIEPIERISSQDS